MNFKKENLLQDFQISSMG